MLTLIKNRAFKLGTIAITITALSIHSCFHTLSADIPGKSPNGEGASYSTLKCGMKIPGYITPQVVPREVTLETIPQVFTNPEMAYVKNMSISEIKLRIYRMWEMFMFAHPVIGSEWPIHPETFNALPQAIKIVTQTTYDEGRVEKPKPDFRKREAMGLDGSYDLDYLPVPSSGEEAWNCSFKSLNFAQKWMPGGESFKRVKDEPEEYWRKMAHFLMAKIYVFKLLIIQIINEIPDPEGETPPELYRRVRDMLNWQPWEKLD